MLIKDPRHPLFFGIVCPKCNFYTTRTFEVSINETSYARSKPISHQCYRCQFVQVGITSYNEIMRCIVGKFTNEKDLLSNFTAIQHMCDALGIRYEVPIQNNLNPHDQMFDV